jgi:predicted DNA-binding transcriptional regulator YafY
MNSEKSNEENRIVIERPRNKKELAQLLGVSVKVLRKMIAPVLQELGQPIGGLYSVNQVVFMVNKYGALKPE